MEILVFFLIFLAFLLACYEDIKKKEIYDYLNFSLAFFIMTIAALDALFTGSILPLKYAGFGLLLGFALGSLLYYLGIWGGGDAKFLIGFSAASFYMLPFTNSTLPSGVSLFIEEYLTIIFQTIFNVISNYILIVNIAVGCYIIYFITKRREEEIIKNSLVHLLLIILFTIGLLTSQQPVIMLIIGLLAFLLVFFGNDYLFYSLYFTKKKNLHQLQQGEIVDSQISGLKYDEIKFGLEKEHLHKIKNQKDKSVVVRKILPLSLIVSLNFIVYLFAVLTLDDTNLEMLFFLTKFLFISFLVGGALAIVMMIFYSIKHHKKVTSLFTKSEKYIFVILLTILVISAFFSKLVFYISILALMYYFVRAAKILEKLMFVVKKPLSKITLGDWIVQDIKIGGKLYYSKEDFKLGVNEEQLEKIKSLSKDHPSLKELFIKDGIAFLPPLFIGFILALVF